MKIKLKWIEGMRKRPVPATYACTLSFTNPPIQCYSVILTFTQQVRTWAELELLVVKDLNIGAAPFYITEGGRIVAEACLLKEPEPTLVRNIERDGVHTVDPIEKGWLYATMVKNKVA